MHQQQIRRIEQKRDRMDKRLVDMTVREYLDVLKSDAPAPGGGSVSALAGAQGAGLLLMVCDLTLGKEKFKDFEEVVKEAKPVLEEAEAALMAGIDRDTEAFNLVMDAFAMPKSTDEEKAARTDAIQKGTAAATEAPLENMEHALHALEAAEKIAGKFNPNCMSDFGVGVMSLKLCIQGAYMNVKINLPGIKDEGLAQELARRADEAFMDGCGIADGLYSYAMDELDK